MKGEGGVRNESSWALIEPLMPSEQAKSNSTLALKWNASQGRINENLSSILSSIRLLQAEDERESGRKRIKPELRHWGAQKRWLALRSNATQGRIDRDLSSIRLLQTEAEDESELEPRN